MSGEASVAFFFGDANLFDLGEVLFGLEWPIASGWTATVSLGLETSGGVSLTLGWKGGG